MDHNFFLPFPISVNGYYLKGKILTRRGRLFKEKVEAAIFEQGALNLRISIRLAFSMILYPPDRRVRDLDNCVKSLQDALTRAGVWEDDRLIDQLSVARGEVLKGGLCVVRISPAVAVLSEGRDICELKHFAHL